MMTRSGFKYRRSAEAQFLGNHFRGFAARKPVLDGFTFERFIESTAGLGGCLGHGLDGSLFTQSSVRQFEAALVQASSAMRTFFGSRLKIEREKRWPWFFSGAHM